MTGFGSAVAAANGARERGRDVVFERCLRVKGSAPVRGPLSSVESESKPASCGARRGRVTSMADETDARRFFLLVVALKTSSGGTFSPSVREIFVSLRARCSASSAAVGVVGVRGVVGVTRPTGAVTGV